MLKFFRKYGLSCVVTLTILYCCIAKEPGPKNLMEELGGFDKWAHFIMFAALCAAISKDLYVQRTPFLSLKMILLAVIFPIFYGGVTELLQEYFFPPRTGDFIDWVADALGVIIIFPINIFLIPKIFKQDSAFCNPTK